MGPEKLAFLALAGFGWIIPVALTIALIVAFFKLVSAAQSAARHLGRIADHLDRDQSAVRFVRRDV